MKCYIYNCLLGINFMARRNATHVSRWIVDYSDIKNYEMLNNDNNNNSIEMSRSKMKQKKFMGV